MPIEKPFSPNRFGLLRIPYRYNALKGRLKPRPPLLPGVELKGSKEEIIFLN